MIVMNVNDKSDSKVETVAYKGKLFEVKDVWIRWLSQAGPAGSPEYGLRFFTMGPGGVIPMHNHVYYQTLFVVSGHLSVAWHNPNTEEIVEERTAGPNDFVFSPSMELHSIRNLSDTESATFLCCIGNVCGGEGA